MDLPRRIFFLNFEYVDRNSMKGGGEQLKLRSRAKTSPVFWALLSFMLRSLLIIVL